MNRRTLFSLLTVVFAVATSPVLAQYENIIGCMVPGNPQLMCAPATDGLVHTFDIYVYNPVNPSFGEIGSRPVEWIDGFECKLTTFAWLGEVQIVNVRFPVPTINGGTLRNIVARYSEPIPVSEDGYAVLGSVDYIYISSTASLAVSADLLPSKSPTPCDYARAHVFLEATDQPSVPGLMAYLDAADGSDPLVGAQTWTGSNSSADFILVLDAVSSEENTWGYIKSLYR